MLETSLYHRLTVDRIVQETTEARSFVFDVPQFLADTFSYSAGQFLTFRLPHPEGEITRCYSLSSAPDIDREIKVTVKRVPGGRGSNWFHDVVREGATVDVMRPAGRFVLRRSSAPVLFLAGGSGITPIISLLKTALMRSTRRCRLFYANRDLGAVIFHGELEALMRAYPDRLELRYHLDDRKGFVTEADFDAVLEGYGGAEAYLCGPVPFMATAEAALLARGMPRECVRIERFQASNDALVSKLPEHDGEISPAEILIHFRGSAYRVPYRRGQSLLDAARAAGLSPPSSCEEGFCGSCAARCIRGKVALKANEVYSEEDLAAGWILTCQGRAVGTEVEISYDL